MKKGKEVPGIMACAGGMKKYKEALTALENTAQSSW